MSRTALLSLLLLATGGVGCHHPSVSAVSLNPHFCDHRFAFLYDPCKEPEGIPFYLPKPLLIISKNFRNIEEAKVGLTGSAPIPNYFDDQAKYADLNARTNFTGLNGTPGFAGSAGTPATSGQQTFPTGDVSKLATASPPTIYSGTGAPVSPWNAPSDGLAPESFFTYHIIFVPDLTQKYGLKIKGGVGEIRAAMNLVNGWQFTGLGPYYMKDSSTAQNTLAGGITANLAASGVADVVTAAAALRPGAAPAAPAPGGRQLDFGPPQPIENVEQIKALVDAMQKLRPSFIKIPSFAEISIYEPFVSETGTMEWKQIAMHKFDRDVQTTSLSGQEVFNLLTRPAALPTAVDAAQSAAQAAVASNQAAWANSSAVQANNQAAQSAALAAKAALEARAAAQAAQTGGSGGQGTQPPPPPTPAAIPGADQPAASPDLPIEGAPAALPSPPGGLGGGADPRRPDGAAGVGGGGTALPPLPAVLENSLVPSVEGPGASRPGGPNHQGLARSPRPHSAKHDPTFRLAQAEGVAGPNVSSQPAPPQPASPTVRIIRRPGDANNAFPTLVITGLPTSSTLFLERSGGANGPVSRDDFLTGTGTVSISGTSGGAPLAAGSYRYRVLDANGNPISNELRVDVAAPADEPAAQASPTPVMGGDLLRNMFVRAGVLPPAAPVPTAAPSTQVNLNQYFGGVKGPAVHHGPEGKRFSLFRHHKKERPVIRTTNLEAPDSAVAATGLTTTGVTTTGTTTGIAASPAFTPQGAQAGAPGPTGLPNTGPDTR